MALVWALVALLTYAGFQISPLRAADAVPLVALLLLGVLSRVLPDTLISLSGDGIRFSFFGIVILAAAVLIGPLGGGLVGITATLTRPTRMPAIRRTFNAGMHGVVGLVGGLAYQGLGGVDPMTVGRPAEVLLLIGVPLVLADLAQAATNALVLSGMMWVSSAVPFWVQVRSLLSSTGVAYVAYGMVAFLLVVLWGPAQVRWFSAVLTAVLLLVVWWVFGQFGAELEAHERTTDTLIAALDVRHPGAAAHAQRVAMLSGWIGESLRLGPAALGELRTAGLLHDIGLLGVREADVDAVRGHALAGVEMLSDISFAAPALPAIAAHHERMDGTGYPHGMVGPQIPLEARIIAVADAFDALTTGTEDIPPVGARAALQRLAEDPGLDPVIVTALERASAGHGFIDTTGQNWLGRAKFAEREPQATNEVGIRVSIATIAADLSHAGPTTGWITRHDHPDDRLGR